MTATLDQARETLAAEWRARSPCTAEDVTAFYREAVGLKSDLDAWHETPERQAWTTALIAACQAVVQVDGTHGAQRVLDVGCGAGHDLAAVIDALPGVLAEGVEPNHVLRQELPFLTYADIGNTIAQPYDVISCLDVFEHVPNPDRLLMAIIARLKMGGIFVEATATHDLGTPLHLVENRGWSPGRLLDRFGFVLREQVDRCRIWQRSSENRGAEPSALVCAYRSLTVETAEALTRLVAAGWRHSFHRGDALISRVRSVAVSQWLRTTDGDVFLMFDDDIVFQPEDAQRVVDLARRTEGIASAAYPVRGGSHLASRMLPDHTDLTFGPDVPPLEIQWAGTGFLAAHRSVCEAIAATMPLCSPDSEACFWPLFQPMVMTYADDRGAEVAEYLSEDWAFCERARQLGFSVWLDPSVFLTHIGEAGYTVATMLGAAPTQPPATDGGI